MQGQIKYLIKTSNDLLVKIMKMKECIFADN